ncbi:zinc-dependent alcohol dehydrogenase family protein [Candidatus Spongiihabitans sp.]|uniref:zinc-dependent alcohol dehydrogenase family protein n=1 Tax=Candidatus Spongiihabitans sp. TaxID=3101308 RepID=UPI003C6F4859
MRIKAAVLWESGKPHPFTKSQPLRIEEIELDPPGRGELLIQIKAVGLCHSDLLAINGERAKPTPMVIGHEGAGVVAEIGAGVDGFEVGDHVVPVYVSSCGRCEMCRQGRPALCQPATKANMAGTMMDGSTRLHKNGNRIFHHSGVAAFAEFAVISQNGLVKIDPGVAFEQAALFGCAVITGVGAVVNTANIRLGQSVAIIGLGGVGFSALLAAIAAGAGRVIAVDINDDKLQLALQLGAHEAFNVKNENDDCVECVRTATSGGVHIAIETAGVPQALDLAYKVTRRGGATVAVGMPGPDASISLSHLSLAGEERTLKGSYMGSCVPSRDIPRYIGLFQDGKLPIDRLTSRQIALDDLNEGFDRLADGSTMRQVLVL